MLTFNGTSGLTFPDGTTQNTQALPGMRNRIINGDMRIDQRGNGASQTPASGDLYYTLDRWGIYAAQASKLTVQQNAGSVTPPNGFKKYIGVTSSSAYTPISTDQFVLQQRIEGFNVADLNFGTASASPITVSFYVRSSLTGTFAGAVTNGTPNRSYPFTFVINSANTWEYETITIPGDTTGTWTTDNTSGLQLSFNLGAGSTYDGTAGSWQAGNLTSVAGAVDLIATSGATFYITGVQLEKGSTATPFEVRPYGQELLLCQRYYQVIDSGLFNNGGMGNSSGQGFPVGKFFPVTMRAAPTLTFGTPSLANCTVAHSPTAYGVISQATFNQASLLAWAYSYSTGVSAAAEL